MRISLAEHDSEIERCFAVMHELRPHIDRARFLAQVKRQAERQAYQVAFVEDAGQVVAVAGFRVIEMLAWGRAMYVDDLVTTESRRAQGLGGRLFDWLVSHARQLGCEQFHLDSGVQRHGAHRFYLLKGKDITSHHFAMRL